MKTNIKKTALSIPVMFQKNGVFENADCRFTKVRIWLMHLGQNFNGSIFEKSVVDEALETLSYIPIVAFLENNNDGEFDASDHRYIITKNENGIQQKYIGSAYGVITSPQDNNAHYEERICDDGETRTFLVVDGLIWNMLEDTHNIMNRDIIKSQSMELSEDNIEGYEDEKGIFHFTKFSFKAACILGKDYEPAMINSTIEVQCNLHDFIKNIQTELNNKLTVFTKLIEKNSKQGGLKFMTKNNFSQTIKEQLSDIANIVENHEKMLDIWGDTVPRYYLQDIQENEVIVIDRKNNYQYYGFMFVMNEDKAEIDFSNGKRKKLCYEDYNDGTKDLGESFNIGNHISEIENNAYSKVLNAQKEENIAKSNYSNIKVKYDEFVKAEQERANKEIELKKDIEFSRYENILSDCSEFVALKENKKNLTLEEIEGKCAILYARKTLAKNNFSNQQNSTITAGIANLDDNENQNFVATKYGNIFVER